MFARSMPARLTIGLMSVAGIWGYGGASQRALASGSGEPVAMLTSVATSCGQGGGEVREFFFPSGVVIVEDNLMRIRVPATQNDSVRLVIDGQEVEEKFGADASVIFTVYDSEGTPGTFPFDHESDETYRSYVEFIFVGASEMEQAEVDGKVGLLVKSKGEISLIDPTGAFPFGAGQFIEAGRVDFHDDDVPPNHPGPHSPKRGMGN